MKTLLTWLLSLACFAAGAQPTIRTASAQVFNRGAQVSVGGGGGGGSPLVTAQTLGTARTDTQAGAGITFVAASAVTIDHLGRWVYSGNTGTHTVSLENAAGTVLTSASVNTTLGTPGQYLEVSCTPFTLVIGTRYFIVSTEGGDTFGDQAPVTADASVVGTGGNAWNSAFVSGGVPQVNSSDDSYGPVNALWH